MRNVVVLRRAHILAVVVVSACSNMDRPPVRAFEEWARATDTVRVRAADLNACSRPGSISASYESDELSVIVGASILPDGDVVVADGLQHSIHVFSPRGPARQIGRRGGGPGEFESLRGLYLFADTILGWDQRALRVTALSPEGQVFRTSNVGLPGMLRGRVESGAYVLLERATPSNGVEGPFQAVATVTVIRPDSGVVWQVRFPSSQGYSAREGRGWRSHEQIFSPDVYVTVAGGATWIGESSAGILVRAGPSNEPELVVKVDYPRRAVTDAMVEAERRAIMSAGEGTALTSMVRDIPAFDTLPVFDMLRGASDGRLIVREYSTELDEEYRVWLIEPETLRIDCLTLSTSHRILDARPGHVLIETRDQLDVPRLEVRTVNPFAGSES